MYPNVSSENSKGSISSGGGSKFKYVSVQLRPLKISARCPSGRFLSRAWCGSLRGLGWPKIGYYHRWLVQLSPHPNKIRIGSAVCPIMGNPFYPFIYSYSKFFWEITEFFHKWTCKGRSMTWATPPPYTAETCCSVRRTCSALTRQVQTWLTAQTRLGWRRVETKTREAKL